MGLVSRALVVVLWAASLSAASFNFVHMISGNQADFWFSVARDPQGFIYVAGVTISSDFETTSGAYQTDPVPGPFGQVPFPNAFVQKLSPDGSRVEYSTYLGPAVVLAPQARSVAIEVDASGHVFAAVNTFNIETDALRLERLGRVTVYKLTPGGDALVYSATV